VLIAKAPTNSVRPSISGTKMQQRTLTGHKGSWTGVPTPVFSYRWQRCNAAGANCVNIAGATSKTYTSTRSDVGKMLRFVVVGTNVAGGLTKTSLVSSTLRPLPQATSGPYYHDGISVKRAGTGVVGVAVHGNKRWFAYSNGHVSPPTFGQLSVGLAIKLKKPIIGIKATPSGRGYWLFASDGGVFTFR
jgi:hypothetical protein